MAAINTVTLIGRVVRDIEVNSTNSGKSVASFALAVDGYGKDADAAPATERYAEDDAKAANDTTNHAAKTTEDVDLDAPIDLSEIPF